MHSVDLTTSQGLSRPTSLLKGACPSFVLRFFPKRAWIGLFLLILPQEWLRQPLRMLNPRLSPNHLKQQSHSLPWVWLSRGTGIIEDIHSEPGSPQPPRPLWGHRGHRSGTHGLYSQVKSFPRGSRGKMGGYKGKDGRVQRESSQNPVFFTLYVFL